MTRAISMRNIFNRMAVILLSFGFCALWGMAQNTIPERLNHVLETQDMEAGMKLYNEITEDDLKQFPDSALFNYHYLGGYINLELLPRVKRNYKIALTHLKEAKRLCETSIGVHSGDYMEVMRGLGDTYLNLGQPDDAIITYQEGIVKSSYMRNAASHDFGNLIIGLQECYELLGMYNEIPQLLSDAWSFWNKYETPLESYTYYPLWCLQQFYRRYEMYDKAIQVSDEIIKFITERGGENHPELASAYYNKANILADMGRDEETIDIYRKGSSALEINHLEQRENYNYILSNLLVALIKSERWDESEVVLAKIKKYGEVVGNEDAYNIALAAISYVLYDKGHYDRAYRFNSELLGRELSDERRQMAEEHKEDIEFSQGLISSIPELEASLQTLIAPTKEWFDTSFKLTSAYFRKKDSERYTHLLNQMYLAIPQNDAAMEEYYLAVLDALFYVCFDNGDYEAALKYAIEKKEYISTIPDIPDGYMFDCMNNIVAAKLKSNKLDGIYEDWDLAAHLCCSVFGEESEKYAIQLHNKGRALQLEHKYDEAKQHYLDAIALHTKVKGKPMPKTIKYLIETNKQITDAELDL